MNDIQITQYSAADFEAVNNLWVMVGMGGAERGDTQQVIERTLNMGGILYLMRKNNQIIGTSWITSDARRLYLHHMCIHPDFQGQGLGRKLLNRCMEWAENTGLQIKLEVNPTNQNAVHLYQSVGFKLLGDYQVFIVRSYNN